MARRSAEKRRANKLARQAQRQAHAELELATRPGITARALPIRAPAPPPAPIEPSPSTAPRLSDAERVQLFTEAVLALQDELRATKREAVMGKSGAVASHIEVPDWPARDRAIDKIFSLLGSYAPKQTSGSAPSTQLKVVIAPWLQPAKPVDVIEAQAIET
jgi:hypothetical protein